MRANWAAHAVLLFGVLLFAVPVWLIVAGATQDTDAIARGELSLLPHLSGLGIFGSVLREGATGVPPVWRMLLISFGMAMVIAVGKIAISLLSAFAIVFFRFPFRLVCFWLIFVALPDELVEAARMDGAGPWRFFRDIVVPVSSTSLAALFVILFVYGWNQY